MQTSDQSSQEEWGPGEQVREGQGAGEDDNREQGEAGAADAPPARRQEQGREEEYDDEAVLKGIVYPPPPSFYLKQRDRMVPRAQQVKGSMPLTSAMPVPAGAVFPGSPSYPQGYPPDFRPAPYAVYPRRQSYAWVWVLVSLIVVLVLSACALFAWLSYSMFGTSAISASDAASNGPLVVNNYYQAVQTQAYKQAYGYLSPRGSMSGLTEKQFIERAQQRDQQAGAVYTFQTGEPNIKVQGNEEVTSFTIAVDLKRSGGEHYTAHLTLQKVGSQWKIAEFDQI